MATTMRQICFEQKSKAPCNLALDFGRSHTRETNLAVRFVLDQLEQSMRAAGARFKYHEKSEPAEKSAISMQNAYLQL